MTGCIPGGLELGTVQVSAQTGTATFTWFGGYHGATYVIFSDANDAPWWESMPPTDTARITRHAIFLTWAPDSFDKILGRWAESGEKVASLISSVAAVAAVFAS